MITNDDLKKMITAFLPIFATKEDLRSLEERIDGKMQLLRSDVMTKMDHVYGEVKTMWEEQVAHAQRHDDIDGDLKAIKSITSLFSGILFEANLK